MMKPRMMILIWLCCLITCSSPPQAHALTNDCHYLHTIITTLNSTGSSLLGPNCCRWPQNLVACDAKSSTVVAVDLSGRNLTATIHAPMLHHLPNLLRLDLSRNSFTGNIPPQLWDLPLLHYLNLSRNKFDGDLGAALPKNWTRLQVLDLSFNSLHGAFPPHVAQLLPGIRSLNVSGNTGITGRVDSQTWTKFGASAFQSTGLSEEKHAPVSSNAPHKAHVMAAGAVAGVIGSAILGLLIILVAIIFWCRQRRRRKRPALGLPASVRHLQSVGPFNLSAHSGMWITNVKDPSSVPVVIFEKPLLNLTFADLLRLTSSFDKVVEVGEGMNSVYKCVLPGVLPRPEEVAIMVCSAGSGAVNDEEAIETFQAMGRMKHDNILPLLGYCMAGEVRILIYKFMQNGTLEDRLHGLTEGDVVIAQDSSMDGWEENEGMQEPQDTTMGWEARCKIAVGAARALAFLHHGCSSQIVHKAISSRSIHLDEDLEPRLALYGLANPGLITSGGWEAEGYVPPEYVHSWNPTTRGDVYSLGVVLLELATGRKPAGSHFPDGRFKSVVAWVRHLIKEEKKGGEALDGRLCSSTEGSMCDGMLEVLRIGYLCTADSPAKRPTMQQVVGLLKDITLSSTSTLSKC